MSTIVSRGFVLVEIIISVMLLSFAGMALLKVNFDQKKLYEIAKSKLELSKQISIVTNMHSQDLHKKNLNLYEVVKRKYKLKNKNLIKTLKKQDVDYTQVYSSMIKLSSEADENSLSLLIDNIKISTKKSTSIYVTVSR